MAWRVCLSNGPRDSSGCRVVVPRRVFCEDSVGSCGVELFCLCFGLKDAVHILTEIYQAPGTHELTY